ncbi:unnamed protein product [Rotaria magnacalcarata]|uniref:Innexin n=5 Tax=Rotaria magnacalcarata TaxID=392030 RepID=A0A816VIC8_9BILA|nr:unnamed protein product [Rotaria magnacalcarata]CAF1654914.1 unnamed protein product [Rotaria magnacalcarata]CAF2057268.1 unnamed protein product [Rotaria magnacalcarata]CAF2064087.1 unnamed protein product [Rotaria magnacalcarata]CAF2121371.1 unnamed protein product [Rotaria magnacalcarata]
MLYDLIGVYGKVGQSGRNDDDVYDRYSHRWTVILLGVFIIAISAKQFVGTPIECIPPSDFAGNHKAYVENYCWTHYTFSIDNTKALTRHYARDGEDSQRTPYYIWIPYILIAAALCTYLPAWLWHVIGHKATFDVPAMINHLGKMKLSNPEDRRSNLTTMAKHYEKVEQYATAKVRATDNLLKRAISACMFFAGGGLLTGIYFLIKFLYLCNSIGQFFLMNYLLKIDYWTYGQKTLQGLLVGADVIKNKDVFPRVVFCDFTIRYLGDNNLNYTVQCTLPVNLYNARIFAFYWFWLIFLTCATFYGIITWLGQMSYRGRRSFLKKHLRINRELAMTQHERQLFDSFADRYLGGDGILFLRLVAKNTNPVVAGELLGIMWDRFVAHESAVVIVAAMGNNNQSGKTLDSDTYLNGSRSGKFDDRTLPFIQPLKQE